MMTSNDCNCSGGSLLCGARLRSALFLLLFVSASGLRLSLSLDHQQQLPHPLQQQQTGVPMRLAEIGLNGRRHVQWSPDSRRFESESLAPSLTATSSNLADFLRRCFLPGGDISADYYRYTAWRFTQRLVSATSSVFGTQALLMALGVKQQQNLGINAATMWVLKDALGKFSRIFWASKNGRRFDSDAKKWRFRSSLLYSIGNALEIFTYILPSLFLFTAALANALKQMALLTSSATRNAIYKSFARNSDNIGDITAKGEAQLAIVDLAGMLCGVTVSHALGASRRKIAALFVLLSLCDTYCTFNEIRSVVFTSMNFERAGIALSRFFEGGADSNISSSGDQQSRLSPYAVTFGERLLFGSQFNEELFGRWSDLPAHYGVEALLRTLRLFEGEQFALCLYEQPQSWLQRLLGGGEARRNEIQLGNGTGQSRGRGVTGEGRGPRTVLRARVLLREGASHADIFRALVVLHHIVHHARTPITPITLIPPMNSSNVTMSGAKHHNNIGTSVSVSSESVEEDALLERLSSAVAYMRGGMGEVVEAMRGAGWDMDRFMFGNITSRVAW